MVATSVAAKPQKASQNQQKPPAGVRSRELGEDIAVAIPADFRLENGAALPDTHVQLRRHGSMDAPVVVVAGGISADRKAGGEGGWWAEMVGAGAAIDIGCYQVIGFDFSPDDDHRVAISPVSQAALLAHTLQRIGVTRVHAFVGASYGGMIGLALSAHAPALVQRLCVISAAHRPAPMAQAWRGVQRRIVEMALAQGDAASGLALARQLAMTTYRSAEEFQSRFDCVVGEDGRSDLDRYLISRGEAYAGRMPPQRWLSLSEAIDRCRIAPENVRAQTTLVACPSDQLVPIAQMRVLAAALPNLTALHELPSLFGHDAFLKEASQLRPILTSFLERETHADA